MARSTERRLALEVRFLFFKNVTGAEYPNPIEGCKAIRKHVSNGVPMVAVRLRPRQFRTLANGCVRAKSKWPRLMKTPRTNPM